MSGFAYRAEAEASAKQHGLDPDLVHAMCMVESSGDTRAYRYEPAYFLRYMAKDERWKHADPRVVSASYGLMQVMYQVALEFGFPPNDPPEQLYIPSIGIEFGCRVLAERMAWVTREAGNLSEGIRLRAALASYNGGKGGNRADHQPDRNARYADKVLFTLAQVRSAK